MGDLETVFIKRVLDIGFKYRRASFNWVRRTDGKLRRLRVIRNHCGFAFIRLSIESPPWDTLTTYHRPPSVPWQAPSTALCFDIYGSLYITHESPHFQCRCVFGIKCIALTIIDSIRSGVKSEARPEVTCFIFSLVLSTTTAGKKKKTTKVTKSQLNIRQHVLPLHSPLIV